MDLALDYISEPTWHTSPEKARLLLLLRMYVDKL